MGEIQEINMIYRVKKHYPKEVAEDMEKSAKMDLGRLLIDKIIELQGHKHVKVRVDKRSKQVKYLGNAEETEVWISCQYREYESVDAIYERLHERIAELKAENQELYKDKLLVMMQDAIEKIWGKDEWASDFAKRFIKPDPGYPLSEFDERETLKNSLKYLREKAGGSWKWDEKKKVPVFVPDEPEIEKEGEK